MLYQDSELFSTALHRYYAVNNLPADGGVSDRWARYAFGPVQAIAFPNFELRNEAIRRHDAHHILNNLDTSPLGEGLIAAWELGSGCGRFWISWFMESQALWWGILLAPKRSLRLFALGRMSQNFFQLGYGSGLQTKTVGELRSKMIPLNQNVKVTFSDLLRFTLIAALGLVAVAIFAPVASTFTVFGFLIGANRRS